MVKETKVKKGEVLLVAKRRYVIVGNRFIPVRTPFFVKLRSLFGKKNPYPLTERGKMEYYRISRNRYVLYRLVSYPCFDFYDFANDARAFRIYYLCRSLAEVRKKHGYITSGKMGSFNGNPTEPHRAKLCPYVYFDDGDHVKTISVYEIEP
jgi:hypothetical protein